MFKTARFHIGDVNQDQPDHWLNSFEAPGYGVRVVGYTASESHLIISISKWKLSDAPLVPVRATIDEIPLEPTINYPEDEETIIYP